MSGWSLIYTHSRTQRREIGKWQREELLKLTSSLMQASTQRQTKLTDEWDRLNLGVDSAEREGEPTIWELTGRMLLNVEQIALLDSRTAQAARAVYELHRDAERGYSPSGNLLREVEELCVNVDDLAARHSELVRAFQGSAQVAPKRSWRQALPGRRQLE